MLVYEGDAVGKQAAHVEMVVINDRRGYRYLNFYQKQPRTTCQMVLKLYRNNGHPKTFSKWKTKN